MLAKKEIFQAIDKLPEQISSEQLMDAMDRLVFLEETREGLKDAREGRVFTAEEVRKQLASWR